MAVALKLSDELVEDAKATELWSAVVGSQSRHEDKPSGWGMFPGFEGETLMTELRQRMIDAMVQRGFAARTQETYIRAIRRMAKRRRPRGCQRRAQSIQQGHRLCAGVRHEGAGQAQGSKI